MYIWFTRAASYQNAEYYVIWGSLSRVYYRHPVEVWPDKDMYIWFTRAASYQNAEYYVIWGFFIPGLLPTPG